MCLLPPWEGRDGNALVMESDRPGSEPQRLGDLEQVASPCDTWFPRESNSSTKIVPFTLQSCFREAVS